MERSGRITSASYHIQNMEQTAENKVAGAVLEKPVTATINGKTFVIPRPTLGTIIEISSMISEFKEMEFSQLVAESPTEVLRLAKHFKKLPRILAFMILGAKSAVKRITIFGKTFVFDRPLRKLEKWISENATPKEMAELIVNVFSTMECGFFLACITSLNKVNHIAPTKTETIQSGQQ